eukprot:10259514-Alexandrium_andersonii.AAC.1
MLAAPEYSAAAATTAGHAEVAVAKLSSGPPRRSSAGCLPPGGAQALPPRQRAQEVGRGAKQSRRLRAALRYAAAAATPVGQQRREASQGSYGGLISCDLRL